MPGRSTLVQQIDRRTAGGAGPGGAVDATARSAGAPLPEGPRGRFEASLGTGLGDVRLHDDATSQRAATQLGARAFTMGSDIHFAAGQLQPDSPSGLHLLAHEVAHTVQQGGGAAGVQTKREVSQPGDTSEIEADRFADHVVHGGAMPGLSPAPSSIQRQQDTSTSADEPQPGGSDEDYYANVEQIINDLLEAYRHIPIFVPVSQDRTRVDVTEVSIPYWNNDYPDHAADPANNPNPSPAYNAANPQGGEDPVDYRRQELDQYDASMGTSGTMYTPTAEAKGSPDEIRKLVQNAVAHGVIDPPAVQGNDRATWRTAWKSVIERWMELTGIGLDCNGLVYQALLLVQERTGAIPTGKRADRPINGVMDTDPLGGLDSRTSVEVNSFGNGDQIEAINLQPGDVMLIPDHVRIVMHVDRGDALAVQHSEAALGPSQTGVDPGQEEPDQIRFTTAESTVDGRTREGETYEGPRIHYWRYDSDGKLWHRYEGSRDGWRRSGEDPTYHRHLLPPS